MKLYEYFLIDQVKRLRLVIESLNILLEFSTTVSDDIPYVNPKIL